ncbi:hypothetical protein FNB79_15395 [Formosa sediminum]|uniref:Uncharacterized protein n=1 Tax=Formosa sediminum TaxID=2594004 RepID=A0A516GUV1_9FLAO|nr:hypothetical protein [Formosa sediminum]QDO95297.1 hypothetical protein FNB79_15395 [Formosa sediminum]
MRTYKSEAQRSGYAVCSTSKCWYFAIQKKGSNSEGSGCKSKVSYEVQIHWKRYQIHKEVQF